jgi:hypothetical protein
MKNSSKAGILIIGIFIGLIAGIALAAFMDYKGWEINPIQQFSEFRFFSDKNKNDVDNPDYRMANRNETNAQDAALGSKQDTTVDKRVFRNGDALPDSAGGIATAGSELALKLSSDQMLFSKQLKVSGFEMSKDNNLDSLLLDDKYSEAAKGLIKIEFWQSPINYTGYKWANNKLLLFGFYDFESVKVLYFEGNYFLHYGTLFYALEATNSFKNLNLLNDAELIKKLNVL